MNRTTSLGLSFRPELTTLEGRDVPAVFPSGNTIVIQASDGPDVTVISREGNNFIVVDQQDAGKTNVRTRFNASQFNRIQYDGLGGSDEYYNNTNLDETARGGGGNDKMYGSYGNTRMEGGSGFDSMCARGNGVNWMWGDVDGDTMFYEPAPGRTRSGGVKNEMYGGGGGDTMKGSDANDYIDGQGGSDNISGDAQYGVGGNDTLLGGNGDDDLYGGFGNDILRGGEDSDDLYGQDGNDELYGDRGNNQLQGGDGDDFLCGSRFSGDGFRGSLHGGPGADTFVDVVYFPEGGDSATDFKLEQGDRKF